MFREQYKSNIPIEFIPRINCIILESLQKEKRGRKGGRKEGRKEGRKRREWEGGRETEREAERGKNKEKIKLLYMILARYLSVTRARAESWATMVVNCFLIY
jgi:hypothetical protein